MIQPTDPKAETGDFNPLIPKISLMKWKISKEEQERIAQVLGVKGMQDKLRTGLNNPPQV